MNKYIYQQINKELLKAEKVLIIGHKKPDGDSCGSVLSIYQYLKELKKNVGIFMTDLPPKYFDFLPRIEDVSSSERLLDQDWDLIASLDCGSWSQTGTSDYLVKKNLLINIDHHITNNSFGDINLVDDSASSTCEIIFNFFKDIGYKINKNVSQCLLTGIITDTGGLINSATTDGAISVVGQLIEHGAKLNLITNNVSKNKTLNGLRAWGLIFSRLKINREHNLAHTYIGDDELIGLKVKDEEIDGLVNFLNVISGTNGVMFFKVSNDSTKVSLRTTSDDIDMAGLASSFGGGGHQKAAGFTIDRQINNIEEYLKQININLKK